MTNYAVIEGTKLIATTRTIRIARKYRNGIHGRRIVKHDPTAPAITLRAFSGGAFTIHGREVT